MKELVFIHGRSQQTKDPAKLKATWIEAWRLGLAKSGLAIPIQETSIHFPFYGDTLIAMVEGRDNVPDIVIKGIEDESRRRFMAAFLREIQEQAGISDAQVEEFLNGADVVVEKGLENKEWFQAVLRAIDKYVPKASAASIALATRDVYDYLHNGAIQRKIDEGVAAAIIPGAETVVVAHSLGTVVAYSILRRLGSARGWKVPAFITVGSPLGVKNIFKTVKSFGPTRCPECVGGWFNALDERDVVALYSLTPKHFPLDPSLPSIGNKTDVDNHTENRHGISGYLDDPEVARRIYDALI